MTACPKHFDFISFSAILIIIIGGNMKEMISIDDFDKIELKVGTIIASKKMENADKLLKNTIQIGNEKRTIVSGIAKYYKPEDIIGKQVVVVTNLKPVKLRGVLSEGMILCAYNTEKDKLVIVSPKRKMPTGTTVC